MRTEVFKHRCNIEGDIATVTLIYKGEGKIDTLRKHCFKAIEQTGEFWVKGFTSACISKVLDSEHISDVWRVYKAEYQLK